MFNFSMFNVFGIHPYGDTECFIGTRETKRGAEEMIAILEPFGYSKLRLEEKQSIHPLVMVRPGKASLLEEEVSLVPSE